MGQLLGTICDFLQRLAANRWFRIAILAVFVLQALFLALTMHPRTPPDEGNHIDFVQFYAEHSMSPIFDEQQPTNNLGDKTREPDYIYHYAMSVVARVVPGDTVDLYVIRVITVITALLTMLVLIRVFERLKVGPAAINVGLAVLVNLPMVLMLSAAVNNDVAVWLGTVLGVLLLLRIWQQPRLLDVIWLLNIAAFSGLIKRTLLPIAAVFVVLLVIVIIKRWRVFIRQLDWKNWRVIVALLVLLIGSGLFVERYGGNMLDYGTFRPTCEQVQSEEACSVFWAAKRQAWLDSLPVGQSLGWAVKDATLRPIPQFAVDWFASSMHNIVDIQTQNWRHEVGPAFWLTPILIALLLIAVSYGVWYDIKHRRRDKAAYLRLATIGLALFIIVLQLAVNYASYTRQHVFGLALNGRYILPAVLLLAGLSCFYIAKLFGKRGQVIVGVGVVVAMVVGAGFIMMVRNPQLFTG